MMRTIGSPGSTTASHPASSLRDRAALATPSFGAFDKLPEELQLTVLSYVASDASNLRPFYELCQAARGLTYRFAEHAIRAELAEAAQSDAGRPGIPRLPSDVLGACLSLMQSRTRRGPVFREALERWRVVEEARNARSAIAAERLV